MSLQWHSIANNTPMRREAAEEREKLCSILNCKQGTVCLPHQGFSHSRERRGLLGLLLDLLIQEVWGGAPDLDFVKLPGVVDAAAPPSEPLCWNTLTSASGVCPTLRCHEKGVCCYLINVQLLHQVQVGPFLVQVSLGHGRNAQLLQAVHHVVEAVLVWQS